MKRCFNESGKILIDKVRENVLFVLVCRCHFPVLQLQLFELTLNASDGKHTASTRVKVTVLDANDNAPEFVDLPFRSENVLVEEDRSVLTNPKLLLTVSQSCQSVSVCISDCQYV